eukprot:13362610-Alexandrium_andersonii.AAC.1
MHTSECQRRLWFVGTISSGRATLTHECLPLADHKKRTLTAFHRPGVTLPDRGGVVRARRG